MAYASDFWSNVMSTRYSAEEWLVWLEEYRQSGLSVKQFCDLLEVSVATFYNWQRKLRKQPANDVTDQAAPCSLIEASFSEVLLPQSLEPFSGDRIEVQLPAGASVSLSNNADSLRPILQVLAEIGNDS